MNLIEFNSEIKNILEKNDLLSSHQHLKQLYVKDYKPYTLRIKVYGKYKKRYIGFFRYAYELSGVGYSIRHQEGHGAVAIKKFNHLVNDLKKLDQKRKITKKPKHLVFSIEV